VDQQTGGVLRSALFVDFDNVIIGLRDNSPRAAEVFGRSPELWLDWLTRVNGSAPDGSEDRPAAPARRTILTRNCYLNPTQDLKGYRAFFTRAGFRVVDCPSLTQQGKSSSDIHMVMDILDILAHPVRYDEVIVMSADADFTSVMLRLRSHDRRTMTVSSSPVAHAYRAACDTVVSDEEFTTHLLSLQRPASSVGTFAPPPVEYQQSADLPTDMADVVVEYVRKASGPVSHAAIAQRFIKHYGRPRTVEGQWFGYGSFGDVLRTLDLKIDGRPLTVDFDTPGYVFDPELHTRPAPPPDTISTLDPDLATFILSVNATTNLPKLSPDAYQTLFAQIFAEIKEREQSGRDVVLAPTAIVQRCADAGVPVTNRQAGFILHGYELSGFWRQGRHANSPRELASATYDSAVARCVQMGIPATDENLALLKRWLLNE
jgi:hypothetical protein